MKPSLLRLSLPWLLLVAIGALAVTIRYGLIEPAAIGHLCEGAATAPAWCQWRQWVVLGFLGYGYGWAALAFTALALAWRHPAAAWLAAAGGVLALQLYCYEAGAFALLVGCLLLIRLQAGPAPADQDRQSQGQVQAQP
jgi:hypothetical protein